MKGGAGRCDRSHAKEEAAPLMLAEPSIGVYELVSFPGFFRRGTLKFTKGRGKNAGQRIGAWAGDEKTQGHQELREGVLHTTVGDAVAVREMDQENGACHDDHDTKSADPDERAGEQGESTSELRQAHQETDYGWVVHERCKGLIVRATKNAKENGAAVIEKDGCGRQPENEKGEIELRRSC